MLAEDKRYVVELACGYHGWWRFNLYMTVVSFDREGTHISFKNLTDRIFDPQLAGSRPAPEGFDPAKRVLKVESDPCNYIEVYIYAVTNTFPESDSIKDSPPFEVTLTVLSEGETIATEVFMVNQWGGLTVAGRKYGPGNSAGLPRENKENQPR